MRFKLAAALISILALWPCVPPLLAQERDVPPGDEEEVPEAASSIKQISITLLGGWSSGGTFLDLPPLSDITQVEEGTDDVYSYDGTIFELEDYYDAPRKEIEPGPMYGARLGFYLSDEFHLDLEGAVAFGKATVSFLNHDPDDDLPDYREQLQSDSGFTSYMGGGNLMYDITSQSLFGLHPFFGLGVGGIINRFTHLQDKTALYFQLLAGFNLFVTDSFAVSTSFSARTFSFSTEELHYGTQVTYLQGLLGMTWFFDTTNRRGTCRGGHSFRPVRQPSAHCGYMTFFFVVLFLAAFFLVAFFLVAFFFVAFFLVAFFLVAFFFVALFLVAFFLVAFFFVAFFLVAFFLVAFFFVFFFFAAFFFVVFLAAGAALCRISLSSIMNLAC
jgi:hypothetical protein